MNIKLIVSVLALLFVASCLAEPVVRNEKQAEAIRKRSKEVVDLVGKPGWQTLMLDYLTEDTIFEIPPSRRYKGQSGWAEFMSHLNIEEGTQVTVTTPINVSGTAAAFTKDYNGKFTSGCPIKATQVVQIIQWNASGDKIVKWTEYFHDEDIFTNQRDCAHDEL